MFRSKRETKLVKCPTIHYYCYYYSPTIHYYCYYYCPIIMIIMIHKQYTTTIITTVQLFITTVITTVLLFITTVITYLSMFRFKRETTHDSSGYFGQETQPYGFCLHVSCRYGKKKE